MQHMNNQLDFLYQRSSVAARNLVAPGPDDAQLEALLNAALRVPDHGRQTPWRLLLLRGQQRPQLAEALASLHQRLEPDAPPAVFDKDRERFDGAPLIVVVIANRREQRPTVPVQEHLLSAGSIAYNLLLGAQALGFGAQWLTGWAAYDREAAVLLGLSDDECVIGFVHIGTAQTERIERKRPQLQDVVSEWQAP